MSLREGDLRFMVKKVFDIDSHKSKIGNDEDTVVLSFTVDHEDPAKDLENFIEMGYQCVLDADVTPGETDDGIYQVFVELERGRKVAEQVFEIIEGIKKLTSLDSMRFRYFKNFKSQDATLENLKKAIPANKEAYDKATEEHASLNNYTEFFKQSYAKKTMVGESITFQNSYSGLVKFDVVTSGSKKEVYDSIQGPIMLEGKDISEVLFLTKTIGNYNITKIGNKFIFENSGWAVALERK
jgi:hypothetical protein